MQLNKKTFRIAEAMTLDAVPLGAIVAPAAVDTHEERALRPTRWHLAMANRFN